MSTKIYNAFRLRSKVSPWSFARSVKKIAFPLAKDRVSGALSALEDCVDLTDRGLQARVQELKDRGWGGYSQELVKTEKVSKDILESYENSRNSGYRSVHDFDLTLCFYEHKRRLYLRYFEGDGCAGVLRFLDEDKRLEDFHYQNSTDPPDDIPCHLYQRRYEIWNEILQTNGYPGAQSPLMFEIVNAHVFEYLVSKRRIDRIDAIRILQFPDSISQPK